MQIIIYNYFILKNKPDITIRTCNNKELFYKIKLDNINNHNNNGIICLSKFQNNMINFSFDDNNKYTFCIESNNKVISKINSNNLIFKIVNNSLIKISESKFNQIRLKNNRKYSSIKYWNIFWNCLHYITYIYPEIPSDDDKFQIKEMMKIMSINGIRCPYCRRHFNSWVSKHDINNYYSSRHALKKYFIDLHNDVNKRNKKKILSYEEENKIYINFDTSELKYYNLDIDKFYKKGTVYEFLKIINSFTRQKLLKESKVLKYES